MHSLRTYLLPHNSVDKADGRKLYFTLRFRQSVILRCRTSHLTQLGLRQSRLMKLNIIRAYLPDSITTRDALIRKLHHEGHIINGRTFYILKSGAEDVIFPFRNVTINYDA